MNYLKDDICFEKKIYDAYLEDILWIIKSLDDNLNTVLICMHNPSITETVNYLSAAKISNIPTSGMAVIDFENRNWKNIEKNSGVLCSFDYPKNYYEMQEER